MNVELQRAEALANANEIRLAMAAEKRRIFALPYDQGREYVAGRLLERPLPPEIGGMKIHALLSSIRKVGDTKVAMLIRAAGLITGERKVRDLTARQRGVIAGMLRSGRPPSAFARVEANQGRAA